RRWRGPSRTGRAHRAARHARTCSLHPLLRWVLEIALREDVTLDAEPVGDVCEDDSGRMPGLLVRHAALDDRRYATDVTDLVGREPLEELVLDVVVLLLERQKRDLVDPGDLALVLGVLPCNALHHVAVLAVHAFLAYEPVRVCAQVAARDMFVREVG